MLLPGISAIEVGFLLESVPFNSVLEVEQELDRRIQARFLDPSSTPNKENDRLNVVEFDSSTDRMGFFLQRALNEAIICANNLVLSLMTQSSDIHIGPNHHYLRVCDNRSPAIDINTRLETHGVKAWCDARNWNLPAPYSQEIKELLVRQFTETGEGENFATFDLIAEIDSLKAVSTVTSTLNDADLEKTGQTITLLMVYLDLWKPDAKKKFSLTGTVQRAVVDIIPMLPKTQVEKVKLAQYQVEKMAKEMGLSSKRQITHKDAVRAVAKSEHGLYIKNGSPWDETTITRNTKRTW